MSSFFCWSFVIYFVYLPVIYLFLHWLFSFQITFKHTLVLRVYSTLMFFRHSPTARRSRCCRFSCPGYREWRDCSRSRQNRRWERSAGCRCRCCPRGCTDRSWSSVLRAECHRTHWSPLDGRRCCWDGHCHMEWQLFLRTGNEQVIIMFICKQAGTGIRYHRYTRADKSSEKTPLTTLYWQDITHYITVRELHSTNHTNKTL